MMQTPPKANETGESGLQSVCSQPESNLINDHQRTGNPMDAQQALAPVVGAGAAKIGGRKQLRDVGRARLREMGFERIRTGVQQAADLLCEVYGVCSWLDAPDYWTALRWAEGVIKLRRLSEIMEALPDAKMPDGTVVKHGHGYVKKDFEPRKLVSEGRALADSRARWEGALGLTASSRASLGADIARLRAASKGGGEASPEDVAAVEARIMRRLETDGPAQEELTGTARTDPSAEPHDTTGPEGREADDHGD